MYNDLKTKEDRMGQDVTFGRALLELSVLLGFMLLGLAYLAITK